MRLKLPYRVKSFFELPLLNYRPVLSPYDFESVVLIGLSLHPRITLRGLEEGAFVNEVGDCTNPVFINSGRYVCEALAGFSHERHGVALVKTARGVRVETGDGLILEGREAAYSSAPGAVVAAVYDGSYTHLVAASYDLIKVLDRAYRGKPLRTSIGYRSFSITYSNGRSQVVTSGGIIEAGFPIEALAALGDTVLAKSSSWIIRLGPDAPRPATIVKEAHFIGLHQELPVFKVGDRLYRLEGGALTPLDYVKPFPRDAVATARDVIAVDYGYGLAAYDVSGKQLLNTPKDEGAACWSIEGEVFCCSKGLCGVVEPGEVSVFIEPINESGGEAHSARISSEAPLVAYYNNNRYVRVSPGKSIDVVEEGASILDAYTFNFEVLHLLGSTGASIVSQPAQVLLKASARAYVSAGIHECGGLSLVELDVAELTAPRRVKVFIEGSEAKPGERKSMCIDKAPDSLRVVAVDTVAKASRKLNDVVVEKTYVQAPSLSINVKHKPGYSTIEISTDAERAKAKLICRNWEVDLKIPLSIVKDCLMPAYIIVELRNKGFIYHSRRDIALSGLLDYAVSNIQPGVREYSEGGFTVRYTVPAIRDVSPFSNFKIRVGGAVEILFKSKQAGRLLVISQNSVKGFTVRPGRNTATAPFSNTYYLVFDCGFSKYVYKLELPLLDQIRAAEQQAQALYSALEKWLK